MEDSYRHKGLRKKLVEVLVGKGIKDNSVLEAINAIPRHYFLDNAFLQFAYNDTAFPIGAGQTISQPFTVAFQTELIRPLKKMKVLEIGTGSGYQTAVLCELGMKVFSIERHKTLNNSAKTILNKMGYKPKLFFGDGYKGLPAFAPFDAILVTCGAPNVPAALLQQLKIGGTMVIPVDNGKKGQVMKKVVKKAADDIIITEHGSFEFVPMLKNRE